MSTANETITVYHKKTKAVWISLQRICWLQWFLSGRETIARENSKWIWQFCFHLWCELTSTMNVTDWQVSWNSRTHTGFQPSEGVSLHHTQRELTWIISRWVHLRTLSKLTGNSQDELTLWACCELSMIVTLTVSSLLPLHGELIGMISWIVHSKLTVWVAKSWKSHSRLTVWVILWVHSEVTECPQNELQCELPVS